MQSCTQHHHCQHEALSRARSICEQQGLRFTPLREQVLSLVWAGHQPVKAYDLLKKIKQGNDAKPPTVYRTLDFLQAHGLVHRLNSLNAYIGCAHPQDHGACHFLICEQCGDVQECCNSVLNQAIDNTSKAYAFTSIKANVEINGTCAHCASLKVKGECL